MSVRTLGDAPGDEVESQEPGAVGGSPHGAGSPVAGEVARRPAGARRVVRHLDIIVAGTFLALVLLTAVAPQLFATQDPYLTAPIDRLRPPGAEHWFGTDALGRDLYSRVIHASSLTLKAALLAVGIALVVGLLTGVLAGFAGGLLDSILMRAIDVFLAIPGLLLSLVIITTLGFGTLPIATAIGVSMVPIFARTTRAEVLRVRTLPYIDAARTSGASWGRVLFRHILPNSWEPVASLAVLEFGKSIMAVAALSFLGFGAQPPLAEWGTLISEGREYLMTAPWVSLLPGFFVVLVVLSTHTLGKFFERSSR